MGAGLKEALVRCRQRRAPGAAPRSKSSFYCGDACGGGQEARWHLRVPPPPPTVRGTRLLRGACGGARDGEGRTHVPVSDSPGRRRGDEWATRVRAYAVTLIGVAHADNQDLLTTTEAGRLIGRTQSAVRTSMVSHSLCAQRIDGRWYVERQVLLDWAERSGGRKPSRSTRPWELRHPPRRARLGESSQSCSAWPARRCTGRSSEPGQPTLERRDVQPRLLLMSRVGNPSRASNRRWPSPTALALNRPMVHQRGATGGDDRDP